MFLEHSIRKVVWHHAGACRSAPSQHHHHDRTSLQNNYFIQVDIKLAWSSSIGDEGAEGTVGWFTAEENKAIEHHYFRSERQALRRLPRSAEEKANKASFDGR
jgi:hypothetical protein